METERLAADDAEGREYSWTAGPPLDPACPDMARPSPTLRWPVWILLAVLVGVAVLGWAVTRTRAGYALLLRYEDPGGEVVFAPDGTALRLGEVHRYSCVVIHETHDRFGLPAVGIVLDPSEDGRLWEDTAAHENTRLAVVLEGRVVWAANIDEPLSGGLLLPLPDGWDLARVEAALAENGRQRR